MKTFGDHVPAGHPGVTTCRLLAFAWFGACALFSAFGSCASRADDVKLVPPDEGGRTQSAVPEGSINFPFRQNSALGSGPTSTDGSLIFPSFGNTTPGSGLGQELGSFTPATVGSAPPPTSLGGLDLSKAMPPSQSVAETNPSLPSTTADAAKLPVPIYATLPGKIALASLTFLTLCAAPLVWTAARKLAARRCA
jgi:hypothetical protein